MLMLLVLFFLTDSEVDLVISEVCRIQRRVRSHVVQTHIQVVILLVLLEMEDWIFLHTRLTTIEMLIRKLIRRFTLRLINLDPTDSLLLEYPCKMMKPCYLVRRL